MCLADKAESLPPEPYRPDWGSRWDTARRAPPRMIALRRLHVRRFVARTVQR